MHLPLPNRNRQNVAVKALCLLIPSVSLFIQQAIAIEDYIYCQCYDVENSRTYFSAIFFGNGYQSAKYKAKFADFVKQKYLHSECISTTFCFSSSSHSKAKSSMQRRIVEAGKYPLRVKPIMTYWRLNEWK